MILQFVVGVIPMECLFPVKQYWITGGVGYFDCFIFIAARVGGGQRLDFMASTTTSWSGRSVLIVKESPGSIIRFAFIETSRMVDFFGG